MISPTGYGGKNGITNGHCGIVTEGGLLSNDGRTGPWQKNYSPASRGPRCAQFEGYR